MFYIVSRSAVPSLILQKQSQENSLSSKSYMHYMICNITFCNIFLLSPCSDLNLDHQNLSQMTYQCATVTHYYDSIIQHPVFRHDLFGCSWYSCHGWFPEQAKTDVVAMSRTVL